MPNYSGMKTVFRLLGIAVACTMLTACSTGGLHGSFIPSTYVDPNDDVKGEIIGHVKGVSSQTLVLYLFPLGESPSTDAAIDDAMGQVEGTKYLTDIAIDDRTYWGIGYSEQVIILDADARN